MSTTENHNEDSGPRGVVPADLVDFVFTADPFIAGALVLVEVQDVQGKGIRIGEWIVPGDGTRRLRIMVARPVVSGDETTVTVGMPVGYFGCGLCSQAVSLIKSGALLPDDRLMWRAGHCHLLPRKTFSMPSTQSGSVYAVESDEPGERPQRGRLGVEADVAHIIDDPAPAASDKAGRLLDFAEIVADRVLEKMKARVEEGGCGSMVAGSAEAQRDVINGLRDVYDWFERMQVGVGSPLDRALCNFFRLAGELLVGMEDKPSSITPMCAISEDDLLQAVLHLAEGGSR